MACERVDLGDGNVAIICGGRRRRAKCEFCKERPHTRLCDFPVAEGKTCDAKMCDACATRAGNELDHCPRHSGKAAAMTNQGLQLPAKTEQLKAAGWKPAYSRDCKLCHMPLEFWRTPAGKMMPLEGIMVDGAWLMGSHWATCVFAEEFRKKETALTADPDKQGSLFG